MKFYNKCFKNSRSQIVFRTDIFQKLTLGSPNLVGKSLFNSRAEVFSLYVIGEMFRTNELFVDSVAS